MEDALLKDRESNQNKKPAFLRFKLLARIENTLRKTNQWQEEFLHHDGCQRLSDWLKVMPDKTYPNQKIVMCIMNCIERMNIDTEIVKESDLERNLEDYKKGYALEPGYSKCQELAKNILNQWYRARNGIQTRYDQDGRFDEGWRNLQRQLDKERVEQPEDHDDDSDEPDRKRQRKNNEESLGQFMDSAQR